MTKSRRMLMIAAALGVASGCGGEPRVRTNATVAGEYVVVERNGGPLPHVLPVRDGYGRLCTTTLVRLVLTLYEDGSWRKRGEGNSLCPGEAAPTRDVVDDAGEYHLRGPAGDTVLLRDTLRPAPEQTGVFDGDELRLVMPLRAPEDTLHFRYVRQRPAD